jgi:Putative metal-binding motif
MNPGTPFIARLRTRAEHLPIRQSGRIAALTLAAVLARHPSAHARANGIVADSCDGCHGSGTPTDVSVTADPATLSPGASITFTLTIRSPIIKVGGAYVTTGGVGTLQALPGEGLAVNSQGLTHTAPKPVSNGAVTFRFGWQAPAKPGAVDVYVVVVAANGNNAPTGDSPGRGDFQWVFGCTATTFYADLDRDGFGSKAWGTLLGCAGNAPPTGYAATDGDCDENDETVHPGATEVCNMKDDNCNGQIDEGAAPVVMWPDGDGDGYYTYQLGTPKMGCGNLAGYAARGGDCDDRDAEVHPGATEICNLKDENCDGRIDEGVRPTCGVGWCARYSPSCDPADCVPGPPAQETCNAFDDDCDGELDNGACPTGMLCSGTRCVATGGGGLGGTGGVAGSPAGGGGTTSVTTGGTVGSGGGSAGDHPSSASGCAVGSASDGRPGEVSSAASWTATTLAICFALLVLRRTKRR